MGIFIRATSRCVAVLVLLGVYASCALSAGDTSYESCVLDAVSSLQLGKTEAAVLQLREAVKQDMDDPLAHTALGVAFLMGSRPKEAWVEFKKAAELDPKCAEAVYGQALTKLAQGRVAESAELFCKAHAISPNLGADGAIRYAKWLLGVRPGNDAIERLASGMDKAITARSLMNRQRWKEAAGLWTELKSALAERNDLGERVGFSATLAPEKPLVINGSPLERNISLPSAASSKLPRVSGSVILRADLARAQDVKIVAFLVDNVLVGITNQPPFQCVWDTTRVPNGQHVVRVAGNDSDGYTITEKRTEVIVSNPSSTQSNRRENAEAQRAWSELWNLMKIAPATSAVNFGLAQCALRTGDREKAVAVFERAMAADPDYPGLRHAFAEVCKSSAARKLYRVQTWEKLIALTFDDGPNPDTPALLDILKKKDVKATFFVVGKRAEEHPDILTRIADEGHEIQNHTYNHRALDFLSTREIEQEIFKTAGVIRSVTGKSTTCLRPPGGRCSRKVEEIAARYGYSLVFWTTNCTTFEGGSRTKLLDYLASKAEPGAIVLMHNAEGVTIGALPEAIDALRAKGYEFVKLSDLTNRQRK